MAPIESPPHRMEPPRYSHYHRRRVVAGSGVVGLADADFAGLAFSVLLFLALAVVIRSNFLMALVPLALAGALGSITGCERHLHADRHRALDHDRVLCAPCGCRLPNLGARRVSLSAVGDRFCPSVADPRQFRLLGRLAMGRLSRRDLGAGSPL